MCGSVYVWTCSASLCGACTGTSEEETSGSRGKSWGHDDMRKEDCEEKEMNELIFMTHASIQKIQCLQGGTFICLPGAVDVELTRELVVSFVHILMRIVTEMKRSKEEEDMVEE